MSFIIPNLKFIILITAPGFPGAVVLVFGAQHVQCRARLEPLHLLIVETVVEGDLFGSAVVVVDHRGDR